MDDSTLTVFGGTEIRDDGRGSVLVAHRLRVLAVEGPDRGLERQVVGTRMSIGTSLHNEMVLTDPTVSRRHCEILVRDGRYTVRDLGSTNGTLVNDTPIVEAYLAPGSRIAVGESQLIFEPKKKWERITADNTIDHFGELYGTSPAMREVFGILQKVAPTHLSCVVLGETGTGKELAARALHSHSPRADQPLIVVDCGAVTASLVESELFGHERGAFTGADRQRQGAFEAADGGTVFLDEIGELPLELQPKLLRALERREVKRLGATRPVEVNVRIVAATHRDLGELVASGDFREDLYYRLAEVMVTLPPLRDRVEDIDVIAPHLITKHAGEGGRVPVLDASALAELRTRSWPGNVRELRNVLRRAVALTDTDQIGRPELLGVIGDAPSTSGTAGGGAPASSIGEDLPIREARELWIAPMEREYLLRLLERCGGDKRRASEAAGLHRKSLERLLRQHGIKASEPSSE